MSFSPFRTRPGLSIKPGPLPFASILLLLAAAGAAAAPLTFGWQAQTYPGVRALTATSISQVNPHSGRTSLSAHVSLDGAVPARRSGEVFVDMRFHPPGDLNAPVDLAGRTVSAWIYAPAGLEGPRSNPNGIRILVKDSAWHSEYGAWTHLVPGKWMKISLIPALRAPLTCFRDTGFNPHKIILVGISIAAGRGSAARFDGDLQIDDVSVSPAAVYTFETP